MRLIRAKCHVGLIPVYIVNYRYHDHGQSADMRVRKNMHHEGAVIRKEYGVPGGPLGKLLKVYARVKRQVQKLVLLGRCDLVPGEVRLKKHLRAKTSFSSNIGVDKL